MSDSAVSKACDVLLRLSADPEVRRLAEKRELAQTTRRIEDGGFVEQGRRQELRRAVQIVCEVLGIDLDEARRGEVAALNADALSQLLETLRATRAWPSAGR